MTDHADTISRAQEIIDNPQMPGGGSEDGTEAWWWTHDHLATFARDVLSLVAERQQAIDERDELWKVNQQLASDHYFARAEKAEARCEQAIDALREIADHVPGRFVVQSPDYVQLRARARAALVDLGEQPQ